MREIERACQILDKTIKIDNFTFLFLFWLTNIIDFRRGTSSEFDGVGCEGSCFEYSFRVGWALLPTRSGATATTYCLLEFSWTRGRHQAVFMSGQWALRRSSTEVNTFTSWERSRTHCKLGSICLQLSPLSAQANRAPTPQSLSTGRMSSVASVVATLRQSGVAMSSHCVYIASTTLHRSCFGHPLAKV